MTCVAPSLRLDTAAQAADERLRGAILAALAADQRTASCDLRVGVNAGVAHLGGEATRAEAWTAAEQVVRAVPGVRGVINRIEAPGAPPPARTIHLDLTKEGPAPQKG